MNLYFWIKIIIYVFIYLFLWFYLTCNNFFDFIFFLEKQIFIFFIYWFILFYSQMLKLFQCFDFTSSLAFQTILLIIIYQCIIWTKNSRSEWELYVVHWAMVSIGSFCYHNLLFVLLSYFPLNSDVNMDMCYSISIRFRIFNRIAVSYKFHYILKKNTKNYLYIYFNPIH